MESYIDEQYKQNTLKKFPGAVLAFPHVICGDILSTSSAGTSPSAYQVILHRRGGGAHWRVHGMELLLVDDPWPSVNWTHRKRYGQGQLEISNHPLGFEVVAEGGIHAVCFPDTGSGHSQWPHPGSAKICEATTAGSVDGIVRLLVVVLINTLPWTGCNLAGLEDKVSAQSLHLLCAFYALCSLHRQDMHWKMRWISLLSFHTVIATLPFMRNR